MSGQNLPLKIRSTVKPLKVKCSKLSFKVTTKLSVNYYFVCCVENKSDYLAKEYITSNMPRYVLGMFSVGITACTVVQAVV